MLHVKVYKWARDSRPMVSRSNKTTKQSAKSQIQRIIEKKELKLKGKLIRGTQCELLCFKF